MTSREHNVGLQSFNGCWVKETGEIMATIVGTFIFWADGPPMRCKVCRSNQLHVEMDGVAFEATREGKDRLIWSDGDVWVLGSDSDSVWGGGGIVGSPASLKTDRHVASPSDCRARVVTKEDVSSIHATPQEDASIRSIRSLLTDDVRKSALSSQKTGGLFDFDDLDDGEGGAKDDASIRSLLIDDVRKKSAHSSQKTGGLFDFDDLDDGEAGAKDESEKTESSTFERDAFPDDHEESRASSEVEDSESEDDAPETIENNTVPTFHGRPLHGFVQQKVPASPACPRCKQSMIWSDFVGAVYTRGWRCFHFHSCGSETATKGPWRWLCKTCRHDICLDCKPRDAHDDPGLPQDILDLRTTCTEIGLSVEWCIDEIALKKMLASIREYQGYGIVALRDECSKCAVSTHHNSSRENMLARMRAHLAWSHFSLVQLEAECKRRNLDVSYYNLRGKPSRDEKRKECIKRLKEQAFAQADSEELLKAWTGRPVFGPPSGFEAWRDSLMDKPTPPDSSDSEADRDPPEWRKLGPRVRAALRQFPGYSGDMPGPAAEELWSLQDLRNYFYSGGVVRPLLRNSRKFEPEMSKVPKAAREPPPAAPKLRHPPQVKKPSPLKPQQAPPAANQPPYAAWKANSVPGMGARKAPATALPFNPSKAAGGFTQFPGNVAAKAGPRYPWNRRQDETPPVTSKPQREQQAPPSVLKQSLRPHYEALGVPFGSSLEDVRKSYRQLALRYHPDKNHGVDATQFKNMAAAYEALSQELKRV